MPTTTTTQRVHLTSLLNRAAIKKYILDKANNMRPTWGCTRVSKEAVEAIESKLRALIVAQVQAHPSIGKTFKP